MTINADASTSALCATVFVLTPIHPKVEAEADRRFGRVVRIGQDGMTKAECLAVADACICRTGALSAEEIKSAPRLRIIARNGTGYDSIDLPACKERGVLLTNVPGGNAKAVAELTIALALAVLRRVVECHVRITSGLLTPSIDYLSGSLLGATVGLIGMGDIAYHAAHLFRAFGCTLLVCSPSSPGARWVTPDKRYPLPVEHERVGLDELLERADVVSVHCPLTATTDGLIGAPKMRKMKPSAVVINTSRGGIVDEAALAAALKEGRIAGAGLDVFRTEPAFGASLGELGTLPNVVCLPHLGGSTDQVAYDGCMIALENVENFLNGKTVVHRVA
ncbi:hypothetical protein Q5752_004022 [Cryptotrichosporon argae]